MDRSLSQIAMKVGLDKGTLYGAARGERGLSLQVARKVAGEFGTRPVGLYVASQVRHLSKKSEQGDLAAVLRGAARITDELLKLKESDLVGETDELAEALADLADLITNAQAQLPGGANLGPVPSGTEQALKSAKPALKSRDLFGRVMEEPGKVDRDPYGRRIK